MAESQRLTILLTPLDARRLKITAAMKGESQQSFVEKTIKEKLETEIENDELLRLVMEREGLQ